MSVQSASGVDQYIIWLLKLKCLPRQAEKFKAESSQTWINFNKQNKVRCTTNRVETSEKIQPSRVKRSQFEAEQTQDAETQAKLNQPRVRWSKLTQTSSRQVIPSQLGAAEMRIPYWNDEHNRGVMPSSVDNHVAHSHTIHLVPHHWWSPHKLMPNVDC